MNKPTLKEVENFIKSLKYVGDDSFEDDDDTLMFSIRDGVDDEPSQTAFQSAKFIRTELRTKFKDSISIFVEVVDEWVYLMIKVI